MAEMTPRERSELVRSQSRAYIAALRENRLQRAGKSVPIAPPVKSFGKMPSAFYPSRQATARAFEAKAKPAPQAQPAVQPSGHEADTRRPDVDVSLGQLREARRPRKARASKSAAGAGEAKAAVPASSEALAIKAAGTMRPNVKPVSKDLPKGFVEHPDRASAVSDETPPLPVAQRRARPRRSPSGEQPASLAANAAEPQDIDVISGLGPALKSKLRRAGIGTADILASQKSERLREILGPAGRLVNLDALVRAAATACASGQPSAIKVDYASTRPSRTSL